MPLDQAEAKRLMDAMMGKVAYVAPTVPMRAALTTTAPTAAAAGTEVVNSGGSTYARQDISTATPAGSTNGAITNTAAVTYTAMPAATVVGVDVYDSNASPRRAMCGSLSAPKTTAAGDSLSFAIGALSLTLQ